MLFRTITRRSLERAAEEATKAMEAIPESQSRKRFEALCKTYLDYVMSHSRERDFEPGQLVGRRAVYYRSVNHGTRKWPYVVETPLGISRHVSSYGLSWLSTGEAIKAATEKAMTFEGYRCDFSWGRIPVIVYR